VGEFERLSRNRWVHFIFYMGDGIDNFDLVLDLNSRDDLGSLAFVLLHGSAKAQNLQCWHSSGSSPSN
jgi:hypothetical protein